MPEPTPPAEAPADHVFVYGTLRRGQANDITRLVPAPRFIAPATVSGTLYDLGAYPGLVLGQGGPVQGEVYAITPALERQLDEIEEIYPQRRDEYRKRRINVVLPEGPLECIVYEINPAYVVGAAAIPGGDWIQRR